eukprot:11187694-Prorocentrum_lima.AAC.1
MLTQASGTHANGLQQAVRSARAAKLLPPPLANRLLRFGQAQAELKHYTPQAMTNLVESVATALIASREGSPPPTPTSPATTTRT